MKNWVKVAMAAIVASWAMMFVGAAQANEVVVLESSSPSYTPGQAVDGATMISLKAGQSISILTAEGTTKVHNGPYEGALASGASKGWSDGLSVVSSLIGEAEAERKRLGATRAFADDAKPKANYIDISQSHVFCAKDTSAIHFWRPARLASDGEFSLKNENFGPDPLSGFWLGKDRTLQWPPGLPIPFGTPLVMRLPEKGLASEVDLVRIPDSVDDGYGSIVWMARAGCKEQAMRLLSELRTASN